MAKRLKTAVLGAGFVGRVHVEGIRRVGFVDLYAIGEADGAKAKQVADIYGVKHETDYRRLLADPELDAVHVATPNALHFPMVRDALEAGKHVVCEKPLAMSSEEGRKMAALAREKNLRHCTHHNLRYYPMVQHMRRMRESGELGEILVVQGTYSQDWLLYDTDWNWRINSKENGPSRTMADIGSHFCDMAEHVTGLRISSLCADLQTFHKKRKYPKQAIEAFAGKTLRPEDYQEVDIDTEDFGSVIFRMGGRVRGAFTASQVSAGRKNRLNIEIYGTEAGVAWDQERPDELWIGRRNEPNRIIVKDPSLMNEGARSYADLPGGHSEGYDDTFKQVARRFYESILNPEMAPEYPTFDDGVRGLTILEAELESSKTRAWVDVPA
ncbi:MAG: Gfo/Idh/MocA family protein [Bryobacteraceae bacterium]